MGRPVAAARASRPDDNLPLAHTNWRDHDRTLRGGPADDAPIKQDVRAWDVRGDGDLAVLGPPSRADRAKSEEQLAHTELIDLLRARDQDGDRHRIVLGQPKGSPLTFLLVGRGTGLRKAGEPTGGERHLEANLALRRGGRPELDVDEQVGRST
jgi:hypothetical protein